MNPVVLVVDDDCGISSLLSILLTNNGYTPITASNGSAALDTLKNCPTPSLILTDYSMPVLDGCKLIENISLQSHLQDIPILLMTGSDINDLKLPTTSNFKGIILKPFKISVLLESISCYIQGKDCKPSAYQE
ncbi:MAG: Phosphate regulon transcriptional regulatory protein PhoB [Candidatus Dichloromethanomonas elyunquensis]|nr:MAG: Phosphate regulon transcriptional regulatory protein PhoB [Candidatus Dichloromethanomonas elyunquensis]